MAVHLDETKPLAAVTAAVHTPSVNHVQKPHVNATRPVCRSAGARQSGTRGAHVQLVQGRKPHSRRPADADGWRVKPRGGGSRLTATEATR